MICDICRKEKQVLFRIELFEQQCTPERWGEPKIICEDCMEQVGFDTQSLIEIITQTE